MLFNRFEKIRGRSPNGQVLRICVCMWGEILKLSKLVLVVRLFRFYVVNFRTTGWVGI